MFSCNTELHGYVRLWQKWELNCPPTCKCSIRIVFVQFLSLPNRVWANSTQGSKYRQITTSYITETQWASYQIRKAAGCACAGNAGSVFPRRRLQRKPLVSGPGIHHGMCVTHVPWCMSGSLTGGGRENVPGILGACAPAILRIWQGVHDNKWNVFRTTIPFVENLLATVGLTHTGFWWYQFVSGINMRTNGQVTGDLRHRDAHVASWTAMILSMRVWHANAWTNFRGHPEMQHYWQKFVSWFKSVWN